MNPVPSEGGTYRGDSHETALCKPDFPKTGGRRSSHARARTMAGRDAAAFIRRRRLIMSLPPRTGTERTCHPAPPDSRTRTRSTFPTFPASGPRRTAANKESTMKQEGRLRTTVHAERATCRLHGCTLATCQFRHIFRHRLPLPVSHSRSHRRRERSGAFLTSHRHSVGSRPSLLFDPSRSRAPTRRSAFDRDTGNRGVEPPWRRHTPLASR